MMFAAHALTALLLFGSLPIHAQSVLSNPTSSQTILQPSRTTLSANNLGRAVNAAQVIVPGVPAPDIGQQVTQAFINLQTPSAEGSGDIGTVFIPSGVYRFSHTMRIVSGTGNTGFREDLVCDPGANISYSGSPEPTGDAILVEPASVAAGGVQNTRVRIVGCHISGNRNALNGIHFEDVYGVYLQSNTISGFTRNGAVGYYFEGSGVATAIDNMAIANSICVETVGNSTSGFGQAANSIHWFGGSLTSCSSWGWFDNSARHASTGYSYQTDIDGATLEGNGTSGTKSGDLLVQNAANFTLENSYVETNAGNYQILIDGTVSPLSMVRILDNELDNPGRGHATIAVAGTVTGVIVEGNNTAVDGGTTFVATNTSNETVFEANNKTTQVDSGPGQFQYLNKFMMTWTTTTSDPDIISNVPSLLGNYSSCQAVPLNSTASSMTGYYIAPVNLPGQLDFYHPAISGGNFAIFCGTGTN